jgi:2-haloacid dehalogenase/putative hydrolase of the HAD superfamily
MKALFLDFYGTLVEEDNEIIKQICSKIVAQSQTVTHEKEVGRYWWEQFTQGCARSYGDNFIPQRELERVSLAKILERFECNLDALELSELLYGYWQRPSIYPETHAFLNRVNLPIYIVSNIDNQDIRSAIQFHDLRIAGMITSEDAKCYKPRAGIFEEALRMAGLSKDEVIHIGDSWSSDILGANQVGIRSIWINRGRRVCPDEGMTKMGYSLMDVLDDI